MIARLRQQLSQAKRITELNDPAPLHDFSDYDAYWERREAVTVIHPRWRIARDLIPDGATVLDVGCGTGEFLSFLRSARPLCDARGVDFSQRAVALANEAGIDAHVHDIALRDLDTVADYVTCFEVIEHIAHAEVVLDRLMRAARKRAIVSIPNVGFIGCRLRLGVFGRFPTTCCVFHLREHLRFWTVRDFGEWVAHCGYRIAASHPQHGVWIADRVMPSLFASGMVYVIEHADPSTTPPS